MSGRYPTVSTPDRDKLIRELWMNDALTSAAIMDRLNHLAGPAIRSKQTLYAMATRLGLPGSRFGKSPPGPHRSAAGVSLPVMRTDRDEVEALLEQGWTVRRIAEDLGLSLGDVSNWKFAWQQRRAQQGASAA